VQELVAGGWNVLAVDLAPLPADLVGCANGRVRTIEIDIAAPGAAEAIAERAAGWSGRIELLCNNAGIGNAGPLHDTTDDALDRYMRVNFAAAFRLSRAVLGHMQAGGTIVHVSSVLGLMGTPSTAAYAASKAALIGLTRQMAREYGPRGIRTNAVAPGLIETGLVRDRLENDAAFGRTWRDGTPFPRLGQARDVARAVCFLASDDAAFVNGHVLVVDGGWSATG
jgi:NAD(P)-dependent dehydrogenase (short-subunit alcohol dehydrogenase family)